MAEALPFPSPLGDTYAMVDGSVTVERFKSKRSFVLFWMLRQENQNCNDAIVQIIKGDPALATQHNSVGMTPMNEAVSKGNWAIVKFMIDSGVDIYTDSTNMDRATPLGYARTLCPAMAGPMEEYFKQRGGAKPPGP